MGTAVGEPEGGDIGGSVADGELEGTLVDGELEGAGEGMPVDKVGVMLEGVLEGDALGKMVAGTTNKSNLDYRCATLWCCNLLKRLIQII